MNRQLHMLVNIGERVVGLCETGPVEEGRCQTETIIKAMNEDGNPETTFTNVAVAIARDLDMLRNEAMKEETMEDGTNYEWVKLIIVLCIGAMICIILNWVLNRVCWRFLIHRLCIVSFLLSVITNYISSYEKVVAKNYMKMRSGLPDNCMERDGGWGTTIKTLFSYLFVISTDENDECLAYARAIVIEPLFVVTPMNAVTTTITNLILTPANLVAQSINTIFKTMLDGIPPFMVPVFVGILLYVFTVCFLCRNNYVLSIPWLLDVKPTSPVASVEFARPRAARVVSTKKNKMFITSKK
uniref:ORF100 n=1 Tax=Malaco herpesvirus 1 TaxID=3031797 RepID=A0AA48P956_9VIRU|nr:TPA_asm: ORF100 [Malaco herpesvirus 1]